MELLTFLSIVFIAILTLSCNPAEKIENPVDDDFSEMIYRFPRRVLKKGEGGGGSGGGGGGGNGTEGGTGGGSVATDGKETFFSVNKAYYEAKWKWENETELREKLKKQAELDAINGIKTNNTTGNNTLSVNGTQPEITANGTQEEVKNGTRR